MSLLERMKLKHAMKGSRSHSNPEPGRSTRDHSSTPTAMAHDSEEFLKRLPTDLMCSLVTSLKCAHSQIALYIYIYNVGTCDW